MWGVHSSYLKISSSLRQDSGWCCVHHLSLSRYSTPSEVRSFQTGAGLFFVINIAITELNPDTHTRGHTERGEASWRQARASIKPVRVWEPFKGHFAPDLQSSTLLTTAPQWPSLWPCGRRGRVRQEWIGKSQKWREWPIQMDYCKWRWRWEIK